MIRTGDKFKDCRTGVIYRVDGAREDLIILVASNRFEPTTLHIKPRDCLKISSLHQMSEKSPWPALQFKHPQES